MMKQGEIVGIHQSSNGRSCSRHICCGECLKPGDLITFELTVVDVNGIDEMVVKAVNDSNCVVGFLPKAYIARKCSQWINKRAEIICLYDNSTNQIDRARSLQNYGIAKFEIHDSVEKKQLN